MQINFAKASLPTRGAVALLVPMDQKKTGLLAQIDKRTKGALGRAMKSADFKGKKGQSLVYLSPTGTSLVAVVLIGVGALAKLKPIDIEDAGGHAYARLQGTKAKSAMLATELLDGADIESSEIAAMAASGALLRSYRFDRYRTKRKTGDRTALSKIIVSSADAAQARRQFAPRKHLASGVFLTRDLVSEPPNILYPEEFARRAKELSELGVKVDILDEKRLEKENMRALLGVGQGSRRDSRLVVMDWRGSKDSKSKPVAFVGKGVTFDTGGISLKPGLNMHEMKYDMGGAGTVTGLMHALAARKAKVNAVGLIGLVENMPDGNAQRPGDVVVSRSGQTIEILNTDAEGRLVLCDVLHYAQERFKPRAIVDLATLTGAILVSLAREYAGLFSNNDRLSKQLTEAGLAVEEKVWRMPMGKPFDDMINSDIADMKNIGGPYGGSITAAQFLKRFVGNVPWAHLDIAGTAWTDKDRPLVPKGGTGFGVRLLDRLVADYYADDAGKSGRSDD